MVQEVVHEVAPGNGESHLDFALAEYREYLEIAEPRKVFDFEEFGAWLDWANSLYLDSTDADADHALAQLRWGIGKVLHEATPKEIPIEYLTLARELDVSDIVVTLNYDCLLERALEAVGMPYRRFPMRYQDEYGVIDLSRGVELQLLKLHGSLDWIRFGNEESNARYDVKPLAEGPRPVGEPLREVAVIPKERLDDFYLAGDSWWRYDLLLLPPSTAKPLVGSPLVELWSGSGAHGDWSGGVCVIGCSLPKGDPYVRQLLFRITRRYAESLRAGWGSGPKKHMVFVDKRSGEDEIAAYRESYGFVDGELSDLLMAGFNEDAVNYIAELAR